MKFETVEDNENLTSRMIGGGYEIGLYPVIYGYRVRVGMEGAGWCEQDLCGGNNLEMINLLYNGCRIILEGQVRENGRADLGEFPVQKKKPFFKDMEFLKEWCDLILKYREHDIPDPRFAITQEDLDNCRAKNQLTKLQSA